jgi:hypothetical protein
MTLPKAALGSVKDYGPNHFIKHILRRQATPHHSLIFAFWHGSFSSKMQVMPGELLHACL